LKLASNSARAPGDQQHLLAVASLAMRHVIVDRAREREALKRGGVQHSVTFDDEHAAETIADTILHLNDALEQLAASEPRLAQVVECRFFGGLTEAETAQALDVTVRTVQRDWAKARELLLHALQ
ncbi:MAG TPA: ECF-type sigma factor, partial [Gemmatimonadaceae bacterium]|nr:ECF-type sigma factor [Gemmatimonadaceae bacterium]